MGKKKQENFDLKEQYRECFSFLVESKEFIYIIMSLFFLFALIGFFVPAPNFLSESIIRFLQELIEKIKNLQQTELIRFIFLNNLESSFLGMVLGVFFGFFSILFAVFNGYVLGFVFALSVKSEGFVVLWRLFPHGVFELPAIFISLGLGLRLGNFIIEKDKRKYLKQYFLKSIKTFIYIVLPLLIFAAFIEGSLIFLMGN